jgi:hypothetical protein
MTIYHISYFYCDEGLDCRIWGAHSGAAEESGLMRFYLRQNSEDMKIHRIWIALLGYKFVKSDRKLLDFRRKPHTTISHAHTHTLLPYFSFWFNNICVDPVIINFMGFHKSRLFSFHLWCVIQSRTIPLENYATVLYYKGITWILKDAEKWGSINILGFKLRWKPHPIKFK